MTSVIIAEWALRTSLAVTVLIVFILLIRRPIAKRFGAKAAYALWTLPLARLFMPGFTLSILASDTVPLANRTMTNITYEVVPTDVIIGSNPTIDLYLFGLILWGSVACLWLAFIFKTQISYVKNLRITSRPISGACALLSEKAAQTVGLRSRPDIRISENQDGPLVTGLFKPVIILPHAFETNFRPEQQYFTLLHEMAHLKRFDLWAAFAALIFKILNWPNPLIHMAAQRFRADQEAACDAYILALTDTKANPRAYAETLLQAAKTVNSLAEPAPLGLTIYHPLKERLMMMKLQTKASATSKLAASLLILGVTAITAPISLAGSHSESELAGKADTQHMSKQVIKSVEIIDGESVKTHYEIIEDKTGKRAFKIENDGARTEVDPSSIKMKDEIKVIHMGHGQISGSDMNVVVIENEQGDHIKKQIKIMTQDGLLTEEEISALSGETGSGKHVIIKKVIDDASDGDRKVRVYNFSSENDFEMDVDTEFHAHQSGAHTKAMLSAASGLLDGLDEGDLSDATKRKIQAARKALKDAEKALMDEK